MDAVDKIVCRELELLARVRTNGGNPIFVGCSNCVQIACEDGWCDEVCVFSNAPLLQAEVTERECKLKGKLTGAVSLSPGEYLENGSLWFDATRL